MAQSDKMPQEMSLECQLGLKTNKFREDRESDGAGPNYKESTETQRLSRHETASVVSTVCQQILLRFFVPVF